MKIKKRLFRSLTLIVALCCVFSSIIYPNISVSAEDAELEDLQQQYDDLEKKIEKNEQELKSIQGDIKNTKSKLSTLNNEISDINSQINLLDSKISVLNNKISNIEANIEKTNGEIEKIEKNISEVELQMDETKVLMQETRELLLGRIRENYMCGESSTLEILFSSTDLSSYFARKELMARVSEKDANLVKELTAKLAELDELEKKLEQDKATLEGKITELEDQMKDLDTQKQEQKDSKAEQQSKKSSVSAKQQEVQGMLNELDQNSAEYKAIIKRQRAEREQLSAQIDEYIKAHGSSVGDTPDAAYENDGKMAWPVTFQSYVSCGYGTYSDGSPHWGMDICAVGGNSRGRNFNAAQGGQVIIAVNDGNWNYGFGNYCVIDHGDGKQTLYAHSDNIKVSVGQIVKKGQVIGIIGATGNVTGPHLHFEVRVKNADGSVSRVNPANYVTNTTA